MEELKNTELNEETEVVEETKESKFKGAVSKMSTGIKKHGKKIAVAAAVVGVAVVTCVIKSKTGNGDCIVEDVLDLGVTDILDSDIITE